MYSKKCELCNKIFVTNRRVRRFCSKVCQTRNRLRKRDLRLRFNLTIDKYNDMLNSQKKCCAICKKKNMVKNFSVDHNHKTGKIRGLLCRECNSGLGFMKDSIKILSNAIDYLKKNA